MLWECEWWKNSLDALVLEGRFLTAGGAATGVGSPTARTGRSPIPRTPPMIAAAAPLRPKSVADMATAQKEEVAGRRVGAEREEEVEKAEAHASEETARIFSMGLRGTGES